MKRKVATIVGIIIILILIIICLITIFIDDKTAPEIEFDHTEIVYNQGDDLQTLLGHVKAVDDVDGDVSDSLMIESINVLSDEEAKIIFVAKDENNNVAKEGKIVRYKK